MTDVFIVAQYKCGTSWLLQSLAAHPRVLAFGEIDLVRVACARNALEPPSVEDRIQRLFGGSNWSSSLEILDRAEEGLHEFPERGHSHPQQAQDLHADQLLELRDRVTAAKGSREILDAFLTIVREQTDGETHLVFKGANQIGVIDLLHRLKPDAPKIAITRDGRDAAISAVHYKRLMRERGAPWVRGSDDYETLLGQWAATALRLTDEAAGGRVQLIRYEDLTADYTGTMAGVLEYLGLEATPEIVASLQDATSFERKTGRERGTPGRGVVRRGMVGEWKEALDRNEQDRAWTVAGEALERLGYMRDGVVHDVPLTLTRLEPGGK